MTVKVTIKPKGEEDVVKVKIHSDEKEKEVTNPVKMKLQLRRTMEGYLQVMDHPEIVIVVQPQNFKVLTFPKEEYGDHVYDAQDRLFRYLVQHGVIKPETVKGGQVYASIEAQYAKESNVGGKPEEIVVFSIAKFIEDERPYYMADEAREDEFEKYLLEPDEENSTELGEVPAAQGKGSIPKVQTRRYITGLYEGKGKLPMALLVESRLSDAVDRFPNYKNEIAHLSEVDPSGNNKYLMWGIKMFAIDKKVPIHDIAMIIADFHKFMNLMGDEGKDINKFKSLGDLKSAIGKARAFSFDKGTVGSREVIGQGEILIDNSNYFVIRPHTPETSCFYGGGWCVSTPGQDHFATYGNEDMAFYFVIFNKKLFERTNKYTAYREGKLVFCIDATSGEISFADHSFIRNAQNTDLTDEGYDLITRPQAIFDALKLKFDVPRFIDEVGKHAMANPPQQLETMNEVYNKLLGSRTEELVAHFGERLITMQAFAYVNSALQGGRYPSPDLRHRAYDLLLKANRETLLPADVIYGIIAAHEQSYINNEEALLHFRKFETKILEKGRPYERESLESIYSNNSTFFKSVGIYEDVMSKGVDRFLIAYDALDPWTDNRKNIPSRPIRLKAFWFKSDLVNGTQQLLDMYNVEVEQFRKIVANGGPLTRDDLYIVEAIFNIMRASVKANAENVDGLFELFMEYIADSESQNRYRYAEMVRDNSTVELSPDHLRRIEEFLRERVRNSREIFDALYYVETIKDLKEKKITPEEVKGLLTYYAEQFDARHLFSHFADDYHRYRMILLRFLGKPMAEILVKKFSEMGDKQSQSSLALEEQYRRVHLFLSAYFKKTPYEMMTDQILASKDSLAASRILRSGPLKYTLARRLLLIVLADSSSPSGSILSGVVDNLESMQRRLRPDYIFANKNLASLFYRAFRAHVIKRDAPSYFYWFLEDNFEKTWITKEFTDKLLFKAADDYFRLASNKVGACRELLYLFGKRSGDRAEALLATWEKRCGPIYRGEEPLQENVVRIKM